MKLFLLLFIQLFTFPAFSQTGIDQIKSSEYIDNGNLTAKAVFIHDEIEYPVKAELVVLTHNKKILGKERTDLEGKVQFPGKIRKGEYILKIDSANYSGFFNLKFNGKGYYVPKIVCKKKNPT